MKLPAEHAPFPLHSVEAEQSLLGAILRDNSAYDSVADLVRVEDFFTEDHRLIYSAIEHLLTSERAVDAVTVFELLERRGEAQRSGGLAYVGELANNATSGALARQYASLVRDRALMRRLSSVSGQIREMLAAPQGRSGAELIDAAEELIFRIGGKNDALEGLEHIRPIITQAVERIDELYNRADPLGLTGVPTGFSDLDKQLSGMHPGDLIVVGGRPSMGKSSFALNVAEHVALRAGLPVAFFSLEMPKEQLGGRLLASIGRLNHHKMRKGALHDEDWKRLTNAVGRLSDAPVWIDETSSLSPMDLRARSRRLHRENGKLGLIVVDYLQLMTAGGGETRQQQIGDYSRNLKQIAKELNCPVMALSQVNRGVENRTDKRPNMSDLRESGDIEQDADVVLFLYRDEVYNRDSRDHGVAEVIIAKQRNGPIGTVRLTFVGELMRFENFAGIA